MKTFGEGFNTELAGLEGKPAALIPREQGRQPAAVVLDPDISERTSIYGEPTVPPIIDQPRVKLPRVD